MLGEIQKPHLEAIGRVTTQFAFLGHALAMLTWGMLGIPQRGGQIVTAQLSFQRLVALATALAKERLDAPRFAELDGILSAALTAEGERNTIAHSTWFVDLDDAEVTRLKITANKKHGRRVQFLVVPAAEIQAVADRIAEAASAVLEFCAREQIPAKNIDASS